MSSNLYPQLTEDEEFIVKWQYRMLGDFKKALIEAIKFADESNLERLKKGFPEEVQGFINYTQVSGWWQEVQRRAGIKEGER